MDQSSSKAKSRKPNWTEGELTALTQGVSENIAIIRGKFGPTLTSETKTKCWLKITEGVNSVNVSAVQRDIADVKKKWQDIQSIAKKKEAARVKLCRATGGGPAPEDQTKSWEQIIIGTLTKTMVEGIEGGEDSSEKQPQIVDNVTVSETRNDEDHAVAAAAESDTEKVEEVVIVNNPIKPVVQEVKKNMNKRGISSSTDTEQFFELEEKKLKKLEEYRTRKIKIMEEMLTLQRRQTIAMESIRMSLQNDTHVFSVSPIINMNEN